MVSHYVACPWFECTHMGAGHVPIFYAFQIPGILDIASWSIVFVQYTALDTSGRRIEIQEEALQEVNYFCVLLLCCC